MKGREQVLRTTYLVLAIMTVFLLTITAVAQADASGGDDNGEIHCYLGAIAVAFVVLSLFAGLILSGRFSTIPRHKSYIPHYMFTILMSVYLTGVFLFGMIRVQWSFSITFHSIIGILIPILSWATTALSPCIAGKAINRKTSSKTHALFAGVLFIFIIAQVIYGYAFLE
jgi:hypothetical protein